MAKATFLLFLILLFKNVFCDITYGTSNGMEEWGYVDVRPGAHLFWWLYYSPKEFEHNKHHNNKYNINNNNVNNVKKNDINYPFNNEDDLEIDESKPLIMWIQGGPGASGVGYGNFEEIGPIFSDFSPREYTWLKKAHLLFVDNPVGTGFSYVDDEIYYTTQNSEVVADLIVLVKTIYKNVLKFKDLKFYVLCESYGGKFTSEFAVALHREIQNGNFTLNFGGIAMGDSWISPIDFMKAWGQQLRTLSLVDDNEKDIIDEYAVQAEYAIREGNYSTATDLWGMQEEVIEQLTDDVDFYNVMLHNIEDDDDSSNFLFAQKLKLHFKNSKKFNKFKNLNSNLNLNQNRIRTSQKFSLNHDKNQKDNNNNINNIYNNNMDENNKEVNKNLVKFNVDDMDNKLFYLAKRRLLKFENADLAFVMNGPIRDKLKIIPSFVSWSESSVQVFDYLYDDFMKPTIDMVDKALSLGINVTIYSGQLDLICCTDGTENWMKKLKWESMSDFYSTPKSPLHCSDKRITGAFVKKYKNLSFFWIMNAGHMVPADNPCIALKMIDIITSD